LNQNIRQEKFDEKTHGHLVEPLTHILHKAYAPLAAKGLKYLATYQPPSKTLERLKEGDSFLSFIDDKIVGTVTLYREQPQSSCEYYRRKGVFSFGQFAFSPSIQGQGWGSKTMSFLEFHAKALGARELALDTSEHADHLIQMYKKRGYEIVAYTQWEETNYRSVIMSKLLHKIKKND
jgi:GNAT superfamily N-acetyltransferase